MHQQSIDITKLGLVELKAIAYDFLIQNQRLQQNLNLVQGEIQRRESQPPTPPAPTPQNTLSLTPSEIVAT